MGQDVVALDNEMHVSVWENWKIGDLRSCLEDKFPMYDSYNNAGNILRRRIHFAIRFFKQNILLESFMNLCSEFSLNNELHCKRSMKQPLSRMLESSQYLQG